MRLTIFALTPVAALVLLANSPDDANRQHRPLPTTTLAIVRGADDGSPTSAVRHCDDQNTSTGQVGYSTGCEMTPGVTNQTVCVSCKGDQATNRRTTSLATGPNYLPVDYDTCSGQKQNGMCLLDPMSSAYTCANLASWDGVTYCGGALYETVTQTVGGPPGNM